MIEQAGKWLKGNGLRDTRPGAPTGPSLVRFALILGVLIVAFFPDIVFAGKSFFFRDFGIFTYPVCEFQRECFWRGELPLWNPFSNCGIPFLAQWNTAVLYPLSLIYIVLPLTAGLNTFFLLHLFLAGLGMYLLCQRWLGSWLAASMAGVGFVFNGLTMNCLMWVSNMAALAWMPWVVLAAERAWMNAGQGDRSNCSQRRILVAAFVGTVQMLAGAPEIILLTWLVVAARWATRTRALRSLGILALIILLISLLSAVQLLPFVDLLKHSERQSDLPQTIWPIPTWGWANLLVPLFRCYRSPLGVYFQPNQDWTSSYYPGVGILAFALLALGSWRKKAVWLIWAAAIAGFVAAMGERAPLYPALLKAFPPLGFMRYPIKFAFSTTFALPILAGLGVRRLEEFRSRALWQALGVSALLTLLIAAVTWQGALHPYPGVASSTVVVNGTVRIAFLLLGVGAALVCFRAERAQLRSIAALMLIVCCWFDIVTHAPRQNPSVDASVFQPMLVRNQLELDVNLGSDRALLDRQTHDKVYGWMLTDPQKDYLGRRMVLFGNCNLLDHIPTPDGFFSLYLREQREVFTAFMIAATNGLPQGLADLLNISKVSNPTNFSQWISRTSALPWCSVGPKPMFAEDSQIPDLLLRPDFDGRKVAWLSSRDRDYLSVTNSASGSARIMEISPNKCKVHVEADAPALVVLSQTYNHSWRVYLDGKPGKGRFQANYAFEAVEVPQGRHEILLKYEDRWFQVGAVISGGTILVCLTAWLVFARKSRPRVPADPV